jgi:hypothetical protein
VNRFKICIKCKKQRDLTWFAKHPTTKDKLQQWCKKCINEKTKEYFRTLKGQFSAAKSIAKFRKLSFDLEFDQYVELRSKRCFYCADELSPTGGGLDRLDNLKGYTLSNVVPCCTVCNYIKRDWFTVQEMKKLGRVIKLIKASRKFANMS